MFMRMVYDEKLAQAAYIIGCQRTGQAIVIDPERDVDRYIDLAAEHDLTIVAAAETHIHADFLSGARQLAHHHGAKVYVSDEGDENWKYRWLQKGPAGRPYDHKLLHDGDTFSIGNIEFRAMHTPGHTPEHIIFIITDHGSGATQPIAVATGDFLFVGDLGRPDLLETAAGVPGAREPGARTLFQSLQKLNDLPDFVQVWPAHGAGSACGKALGAIPTSTIGYEKRFNTALRAASSEQSFINFILEGQPEPPLYFAAMKRDNRDGPRVLDALPTPPNLDPTALTALDPATVAIIDTRPWEAFKDTHLTGSMSFPLISSFNTDAGSMVKDSDDIVLIAAPEDLDEAIRDLIRIGLDRIVGWYDAADVNSLPTTNLSATPEYPVEKALALAESSDVQVLDVRRATEHAAAHIPGAINIAHTRLAARLDELPHKRLLIHCRSGVRSARASAYLQREGYDIVNLKGGFLAWEQAGGPTERTSQERITS